MKLVLKLLAALVVAVVLLVAVGFALPSAFKVERAVQIEAPAAEVYALIASPREWKRWSAWNARDPDMRIEYTGPEAGVGAGWSWQSATEGNGAMEFTAAVPGERVDYVLRFPDFGMESKGVLRIEPAGSGVRLSWSNEGDMGGNPISRWFGLFMDSLVGPDFEAGLASLKRLAEAG
ncbi:SRPBCC family protein [Aquimonas voraii]|uniref:Polyketide cyclase / dehydrase and lipid transport n=1 Tax=Aquimonas voraii TaxID=265719 RepID=A0A1G6X3I8_9GAMM|nr:SRPBCC family protein [Aquimonas voraii]SDD72614.1 Polyketide cyclase / dehydrase and lipid transport [Aquimonas voraii]